MCRMGQSIRSRVRAVGACAQRIAVGAVARRPAVGFGSWSWWPVGRVRAGAGILAGAGRPIGWTTAAVAGNFVTGGRTARAAERDLKTRA
jgi:hypothetical protein